MLIGSFVKTVAKSKQICAFPLVKSACELDFGLPIAARGFHLRPYLPGSAQLGVQKDEEKTTIPLDKEKAKSLILKLSEEERNLISNALKEFDALKRKEDFAGQLAALKWRSKFGRPSKVASLGDVDPTGSYCPVPEDWLLKKYAETVPKPTKAQLIRVFLHNAIPFVGFGFLDNAVMILCGDYIEMKLGVFMTISTMAAAALGNTFSDILGLGSAYYVERLAFVLGFKAPDLSPIQMNMASTRRMANLGRAFGVTIGCILGMSPLLILMPLCRVHQRTVN